MQIINHNKSPFVKTIKTINGFYAYDVNRDSIVKIDHELYEWLNGRIDYHDLSETSLNSIKKMKELGILSSKKICEIRHPQSDNLQYQLDNNVEQLVLQVTQNCNLACTYCPYANKTDGIIQRNHSNKTMSWETARRSIDFFCEHSTDVDKVIIGFYGGEPILAFELIKKCIYYARKKFTGKDIIFTITTNGTLLKDEIIDFLACNNVNIMFSIDGPASIHNVNRRFLNGKGTFDITFSNFRKVLIAYGENAQTRVSINMVLNPEGDPEDTVLLFREDVFKSHNVHVSAGGADDSLLENKWNVSEKFLLFIRKWHFICILKYLSVVDNIEVPLMFNDYILNLDTTIKGFHKMDAELPDEGAPSGPCIPGQRHLFVSAEGTFFPCERVSELSGLMRIGNLETGFDYDKALKLLNIASLTPEICRNCFALRHCKVCCGCLENGNTFDVKKRSYTCEESKSEVIYNIYFCALVYEWNNYYKKVILNDLHSISL